MERLILLLSAVLIFVAAESVIGSERQEERRLEQLPKKKLGQMWFGPRLGRRKRNPNDIYRAPGLERQQLEGLMELIQESPWAVIAVNEGKRYDVNFVPRLGRESGEDMVSHFGPNPAIERLLQDDAVSEVIAQRSPPFAPRLGKRVLPFSPRLGRENFQLDRL